MPLVAAPQEAASRRIVESPMGAIDGVASPVVPNAPTPSFSPGSIVYAAMLRFSERTPR
jgi:hypothetical protein